MRQIADQLGGYPVLRRDRRCRLSWASAKSTTKISWTQLLWPAKEDGKILIEEFVDGQEVESPFWATKRLRPPWWEVASFADFMTTRTNIKAAPPAPEIPPSGRNHGSHPLIAGPAYRMTASPGWTFSLRSPTGAVLLNELNTLPGLPHGPVSRALGGRGVEYPDLLDQLIGLALQGNRN